MSSRPPVIFSPRFFRLFWLILRVRFGKGRPMTGRARVNRVRCPLCLDQGRYYMIDLGLDACDHTDDEIERRLWDNTLMDGIEDEEAAR